MNNSKGDLMLKHTKIGILATFLVATSPVLAQESEMAPKWDAVVATVNGQDITLGHLIIARENLPAEYQSLEDSVLFDGILENLIQQSLLEQTVADKMSERDTSNLEHQKRAYLAGVAVDGILKAAVTDEALQELYTQEFENGDPVTEYNAAHILVETEEEANDIVKLLNEGADFAQLAKEKSTGPSGPNGGNLGWFGPGAMVPSFEEAVIKTEDGAYSDPVQTQFGWHVIHRLESRKQDTPAFEEVRGQLEVQVQQRALEDEITRLTDEATITKIDEGSIDPSLLSNSELTGE